MSEAVLLDTHALLWFDVSPQLLTPTTLDIIRDNRTQVWVSSITAWELSIKHRLGKLPEAGALLAAYHRTIAAYGFLELPFTSVHALLAAELEHPHRDPFDRALVAQAVSQQLRVVSADQAVHSFPQVSAIW